MHPSPRTVAALAVAALAAALALTGCGSTSSPAPDQGSSGDTSSDTSSDDDSSSPGLLVLSGTGSYAIGTDAPYGGYQLSGEPAALPAGCTWSILDADGGVFLDQSNGLYVFITDVPEAVTFVTNGCPDWEQFE